MQLNASTLVKLLRLFITISFTKDEKDYFTQLDDYNEPFCEQQNNTYMGLVCLFAQIQIL